MHVVREASPTLIEHAVCGKEHQGGRGRLRLRRTSPPALAGTGVPSMWSATPSPATCSVRDDRCCGQTPDRLVRLVFHAAAPVVSSARDRQAA